MKTIIVYSSKYGTTEKCSEILKNYLEGEVEIINLKKEKIKNLNDFDTILIGGSIYIGKIQKEVKKFCEKNIDIILKKNIGLFICAMAKEEDIKSEILSAYPKEISKKALVMESFGGEYKIEKMNFLEKSIIKKVAGIFSSTSSIKEDKIKSFADIINLKNKE